jgi:glycosyltransferase involved in cell wall biosynthesis
MGRGANRTLNMTPTSAQQSIASERAAALFSRPLGVDEQPLVSVVTPVYNGEEFLAECIDSVLAQTYQNWEYTIVNNCSTDRSLEIAQSYCARDPRIRIHDNQDFLPIIQNHNNALRQISPHSKYCKVVLADDWIAPECLLKMVVLAESDSSVGLVGAYGLHGDGVHVIWRGIPFPRCVVPGREVCRLRLLRGIYVCGTPTASLIRSDLVRKRSQFYDESNLHADSTACFRILQEANFGFVHQILTFTRTRDQSNTTFAEKMNSIHLSFLTEFIQFGPLCLDEKEYRQRMTVLRRDYYRVLAEGLLQMRGKAYWQFHTKWLRDLGIPLSWRALLLGFLMAVINALSHPLLAFHSICRWWSQAKFRLLSSMRRPRE